MEEEETPLPRPLPYEERGELNDCKNFKERSMNPQRKKPYWKMNARELGRATGEFDEPFSAETFHTLTPSDRTRWERVRKHAGRPRHGRGVKIISVSVEKNLLVRSDHLAKRMGLTRAALIARGLKAIMAAEGEAV